MLQEFLQKLMSGGAAPVQPQNRLGLAPSMMDGPGAAGPGILAYHNALSGMSAPQQAAPQGIDPMMTAQTPAMQQQAAQAAPAPAQGGGIGGFLGNIFNPGGAGRNQTVQWLQTQGMDEGMATLMAGNKSALQNYLLDRSKGSDPKDALELAKLQLEVGNLQNPQLSPGEAERLRLDREKFGFEQEQAGTTSTINEYEYYADQARQNGQQPATFDVWEANRRKAGATNISNNVGNGKVGTIPPGYELIEDPTTGNHSMRPIPGGPAEAELNYQAAVDTADQSLANIDAVINDPNLGLAVGVAGVLPPIPGTPQAATVARIEQLQGSAFLQAFETLKGGGQITEVEGKKAEQAIARLNRAQRKDDFVAALNDLKSIIQTAKGRAQRKLGGGGASTAAPGGAAGGQTGDVIDYRDWLGSE